MLLLSLFCLKLLLVPLLLLLFCFLFPNYTTLTFWLMFFSRLWLLLPDLLFGLGEDRMAVALETTAIGSLPVITQETLLQALYDAYSDWFLTSEVGDVPTLDEVQYKYNLCRNA